MTFAANIEKASEKVTTLVRIRPRKRLEGWVVNGTYGNVYQVSWAENVVAVYSNSFDSASAATDLADCAATDYSYFYDSTAEILYFNPNGTDNPNTNVTSVEWNWFVASEHLNWYSDPLNSASSVGIWSGGLIKPAIPTQGNPDLAFGYLPLQITSIEIQFADGEMLEHAYAWSLNKSPIKVWECVGDLAVENISETFTGACGNYSISGGAISIQCYDATKIIDERIDGKFFTSAFYPLLDPNAENKTVRYMYGVNSNIFPTNIDYNSSPTTLNNRHWVTDDGAISDAATLTLAINHTSPNNTATTTQLFDASGLLADGSFFRGDTVIIYDNGVAKYTHITAVNYSTNVITHDSIGARTPVVTDTVVRPFVGQVTILAGGAFFYPLYGRDYFLSNFTNGVRGFSFTNNFEASLGGFPSPFDPSNHTLSCRVYGNKTLPKKLDNVTDFGQVTERGGSYANPVTIIWDIFRNKLRNFEDYFLLDETDWQALAIAFDRPVGICIPDSIADSFPSWKDVVQRLLQTELLKIHYKIDSGLVKLTISQTQPISGTPEEITNAESGEKEFFYSYDDTYESFRFTLNQGEATIVNNVIEQESDPGFWLHRAGTIFNFDTLFQFVSDAQVIADRITFIYGERRGTVNVRLPLSFIRKDIDEAVTLASEYLPGFAFSGQINTRNHVVLRHAKSSNGVTVVLDDQKGIEDNSGDW